MGSLSRCERSLVKNKLTSCSGGAICILSTKRYETLNWTWDRNTLWLRLRLRDGTTGYHDRSDFTILLTLSFADDL